MSSSKSHWSKEERRRKEVLEIIKTLQILDLSDSKSARGKPGSGSIPASSDITKSDRNRTSEVTSKSATGTHRVDFEGAIHRNWATPPKDVTLVKRLNSGASAEVWVSLSISLPLICQCGCHFSIPDTSAQLHFLLSQLLSCYDLILTCIPSLLNGRL